MNQVKVYILMSQIDEQNIILHPKKLSDDLPVNITLKKVLDMVSMNLSYNLSSPRSVRLASEVPDLEKDSDNTVSKQQLQMDLEEGSDNSVTTQHLQTESNFMKFEQKDHVNNVDIVSTFYLKNNDSKGSIKILSENELKVEYAHDRMLYKEKYNVSETSFNNTLISEDELRHESIQEELISDKTLNVSDESIKDTLPSDNEEKYGFKQDDILLEEIRPINVSMKNADDTSGITDIYYVVHGCRHEKCKIEKVVVLKTDSLQESHLQTLLISPNECQNTSSCTKQDFRRVTFSEWLKVLVTALPENAHWWLAICFALVTSGVIKLLSEGRKCKIKVDSAYNQTESFVSDMREMADILSEYVKTDAMMEKWSLDVHNKLVVTDLQIRSLENEIHLLKQSVININSRYPRSMDDLLSEFLNYLRRCLRPSLESDEENLNYRSLEMNPSLSSSLTNDDTTDSYDHWKIFSKK